MKGSIVDTYRDPLPTVQAEGGLTCVQVFTPQDCQSGACSCSDAEQCKFKRCDKCDNILHALTRLAYFQCRDVYYACPACGGDPR